MLYRLVKSVVNRAEASKMSVDAAGAGDNVT